MEKINYEQEIRGLKSDLEDIGNQYPDEITPSYWQEARSLYSHEESVYTSLRDLEYLQDSKPDNPTNGVRLKAIIGKTKYGKMAQLDGSKGRMVDNDEYEIEGIFLGHSNGYPMANAYRTNSNDISKLSQAKSGDRIYVEIGLGDKGVNFSDPQGFYRKLSEWGYSLIDSKIEII